MFKSDNNCKVLMNDFSYFGYMSIDVKNYTFISIIDFIQKQPTR